MPAAATISAPARAQGADRAGGVWQGTEQPEAEQCEHQLGRDTEGEVDHHGRDGVAGGRESRRDAGADDFAEMRHREQAVDAFTDPDGAGQRQQRRPKREQDLPGAHLRGSACRDRR